MNSGRVLLVAATLVTTVFLAGCAAELPAVGGSQTSSAPVSSEPEASGDTTPDAATSAPTTGQTCERLAWIGWQGERVGAADEKQVAVGAPFDSGAREGAAGTAHLDADGRVIGYTVSAGDAPSAIQDRFCIDGISVLHFNGYWVTGDGKDIAPDDYLYLVPDPAVVYVGPDL